MTVSMRSPQGHLAIMAIKGVGPKGARRLVEAFSTIDDMRSADDEAFKGAVNQTVRDRIRDRGTLDEALIVAEREMEKAERLGARIVTKFDAEFPARLTDGEDNPLLLYVKGDISSLARSVACVGTREPSKYGMVVTDRLAGFLAQAGYAIVSGLALGVDSISHRAALREGAQTVAFLGSGLDKIGHGERGSLAEDILASGGGIATEQPFGAENDLGTLIRRNRLQSGSSLATFIMQCGTVSGTMHTMRYAAYQGRPLYVPMPPMEYQGEPENAGVMLLARTNGADLCGSIEIKKDLQEILERDYTTRVLVNVLRGRDDYPRMLEELESLQASTAAPALA